MQQKGDPYSPGGNRAPGGPDLSAVDRVALMDAPTPIDEMTRLRAALGGGPRLLVKRDDAIPFAFGGNKVRKLEFELAAARAAGADTLVTVGGVQSNHARATAAAARKLGMQCRVIVNGAAPARDTGNALLRSLLGADVEYIASRSDRAGALSRAMERAIREGRKPYIVPLGASTPRGALGYVRAVGELLEQIVTPAAIVHACSSGGTQAGLVAGCALHGVSTRVIGISADDPAPQIQAHVREIIAGTGDLLEADRRTLAARDIEIDDGFVGSGYGLPTPESLEAQSLAARTEALFVDNTYTAKALAAVISLVRRSEFPDDATVVFWHTGGQVGIFG